MRIPDWSRGLIPRRGPFNAVRNFKHFAAWRKRGYAVPAPPSVNRRILERWGQRGGTWIETGTYLGDTTAFLSRFGPVVSIEPQHALFERAQKRFQDNPAVTIVQGTSEEAFADIVSGLIGPINFWLDGHFSEGVTFQGELETPILHELEVISSHLERLSPVTVLVDDVRCFDPKIDPQYPHRRALVHWADDHGLNWTFDQDIFVAWTDGVDANFKPRVVDS